MLNITKWSDRHIDAKKNKKGVRKSFIFPEEALKRLDGIKWVCRLSSQTETIRLALMVLEELVVATNKGETIVIRDQNGNERSYHPLYENDGDGGERTADIMKLVEPKPGLRKRAA